MLMGQLNSAWKLSHRARQPGKGFLPSLCLRLPLLLSVFLGMDYLFLAGHDIAVC